MKGYLNKAITKVPVIIHYSHGSSQKNHTTPKVLTVARLFRFELSKGVGECI